MAMNKYIENKSYRDKPTYLSGTDRVAYTFTYILIIISSLFIALVYLSVKSAIAFDDESILATAGNVGVRWIIPLCLSVISLSIYIDINYRWKDVPFFTRKKDKNIKSPTAQKEHVSKRVKKKKTYKILAWILLFFSCIIISLPGLFSRACIDNAGTLHCYDSFNQKLPETPIDELESLIIKATTYDRLKSYDTDFWLTLRYSDEKEYTFYTSSFNTVSDDYYSDALNGMIMLKELVPKEKVEIVGADNLEEIIEMYEFNGKQNKLLYKLFEIE